MASNSPGTGPACRHSRYDGSHSSSTGDNGTSSARNSISRSINALVPIPASLSSAG